MTEEKEPRGTRTRRSRASETDEQPGQAPPEGETQSEASAKARADTPKGSPKPPSPGLADLPISWSFRGLLITYVLLLLSVERAHGYFIEQYLRGLGLFNVELSSLYRTLRQLENAGLVVSSWEHGPEGPARRVYSLTDNGRWWLDTNASVLQSYRGLIDRFFGSYSRPNRPADKKDDQEA